MASIRIPASASELLPLYARCSDHGKSGNFGNHAQLLVTVAASQ